MDLEEFKEWFEMGKALIDYYFEILIGEIKPEKKEEPITMGVDIEGKPEVKKNMKGGK